MRDQGIQAIAINIQYTSKLEILHLGKNINIRYISNTN